MAFSWNRVWNGMKVMVGMAQVLAPIAATVAKETGNDEVVGDINKAGVAAGMAADGMTKIEDSKK
jgi:hypothetical protein